MGIQKIGADTTDSPVAELSGVAKRFGDINAVDGIDLTVGPGEAVAFLGPNGAGKSTTINLLLGLLRPNSGHVALFGRSPWLPAARRLVGATPQETDFPPNLSVAELLGLVAAHFPAPAPIQALLRDFGLDGLTGRHAAKLSGGERRRLALAMAFAGNPRAVFLDEPTTGLDVEARQTFWHAVRRYHQGGGAVFLTTHYLEEAEALADRVVLIDRGRIVQQGAVAEIKARFAVKRLRFRAAAVPDLPGFAEARLVDGRVVVDSPDTDALVRSLIRADIEFDDLEVEPVSLEDAVVSVFRDDRAAAEQRTDNGETADR